MRKSRSFFRWDSEILEEEQSSEETKCLTCKGTGKIPLAITLSDCPDCDGSGKKKIKKD